MGDLMAMDYGNFTITARWNHVFNQRLFMNVSSIYSNYRYDMGMKQDVTNFQWVTYIRDFNQEFDLTYYLNPENTIKFGAQVILDNCRPGEVFEQ